MAKYDITRILDTVRAAGRETLLETEALAVVRELGFAVPVHVVIGGAQEAAAVDLDRFPSERLVIKVVSPEITHKSDLGGVAVVRRERGAVVDAVEVMEERFASRRDVVGFSLNEYVEHDAALGGELLLGTRWTDEFGPVVTFGPGGIYAEHLSAHLREGVATAILSSFLTPLERIEEALAGRAITPAVTGDVRGQAPRLAMPALVEMLSTFLDFAGKVVPNQLAEIEINPLVLTARGPVALDAFGRLGGEPAPVAAPRPLDKLECLLHPRSIAIMGVSEKVNPGRVILGNVLRAGFDPERIWVVKPGREELDGCRCVPDVASLPERVDLMVLAIGAAGVPAAVEEILAGRKAESLILITGGMGEREGSEGDVEELRRSLAEARRSEWRGPVINGGNCLGVRSRPGRYDTLFIPRHKLRFPEGGEPEPLAVIPQSGA